MLTESVYLGENNSMRSIAYLLASTLAMYACGTTGSTSRTANKGLEANSTVKNIDSAIAGGSDMAPTPTPETTSERPKTVRDFFALLPEKYFTLEGCDREKDKDCKAARADYLKAFTEVEDIANGYFKGGCDGAQSCIEMAIFKRPDGSYLVAVATAGEMINDFYFLDYTDGKWTDISVSTVPEFSKKNWYELPRVGTTVKVFSKKIVEKGDDYEISEKGKKLYDLEWKDGKFAIKR